MAESQIVPPPAQEVPGMILKEAEDYFKMVIDTTFASVWPRYHLGQILSRHRECIPTFARHLACHPSLLYQCQALALRFPDEDAFRVHLFNIRQQRGNVSWDAVRRKLLPPLSLDPAQLPDPHDRVDKLLGVAEAAIHELESYWEHNDHEGDAAIEFVNGVDSLEVMLHEFIDHIRS